MHPHHSLPPIDLLTQMFCLLLSKPNRVQRFSVQCLARKYRAVAYRRDFSSADAVVAPLSGDTVATAHTTPPKVIFPWHHSTDPLPRLVPGSPEFRSDILFTRGGQSLTHACLLSKRSSVLGRLGESFGGTWREELSQSAGWAFLQAVAGVVSNVYDQPVVMAGGELHFQYQPPARSTLDNRKEAVEEVDDKAETIDGEPKIEKQTSEEKKADDTTTLGASDRMISERLRNLFEAAHASGRGQLQIELQIQPTGRCFMYNLLVLPFLNRELVEKDTVLRKMLRRFHTARHAVGWDPRQALNEIYQNLLASSTAGKEVATMKTTVEMQVLVECVERFCVTDVKSGAVIQGSTEANLVTHLARFEKTVTNDVNLADSMWPQFGESVETSWVLTDIDDLLGHQTWYHGVEP